jgi:CDP-diacylglycerol--glycerol-3-phosphate 3-phosphatidyltransferase
LIRPKPTAEDLVSTNTKTIVYPLAQFTPLLYPEDTSTERPALSAVLRLLSRDDLANSRWVFTAGYFNIHSQLKELLLASKSTQGIVITAAPEANGFYGSKGVSGMLPPAYTLLARRFLGDVTKSGKGRNIQLREWRRGTIGSDPGAWTYHAKGTRPGPFSGDVSNS